MSRLAYFTRETLISLRRNLLMTFAGVMTVAVSLFLFGGILLVSRTVDHGTNKWKHGVELEIFMQVKASNDADRRRATSQLEGAIPNVKSYRFLDHQDAYKEFKKLLRRPAGARRERRRRPACPTSFRVVPIKPQLTEHDRQRVPERARRRHGQHAGQGSEDAAQRDHSGSGCAFFVLAGVLLASSLFLIVNTIRLATFARRREIEVMKLVGRVELVRARAVHGRGLRAGRDRRRLRGRPRVLPEVDHHEAAEATSTTCSSRSTRAPTTCS